MADWPATWQQYEDMSAPQLQQSADLHLSAGIIFDATYSGKAFHALREDIRADPAYWKGRKVTRNSTLTDHPSVARTSPSSAGH